MVARGFNRAWLCRVRWVRRGFALPIDLAMIQDLWLLRPYIGAPCRCSLLEQAWHTSARFQPCVVM